jgi:hypothetical protein
VATWASVERLYRQFSVYPRPSDITVCPQCGPEWSRADIIATPLRSLSLAQLGAVHVMSLDDDGLRHFFPRLMELMLETPAPVFDFRVADFKTRIPAWQYAEVSAVRQFAEAVWARLLATYPAELGYFSDCPSALELLDWCGLSLTEHLNSALAVDTVAAARHLADLVDVVFIRRGRFETLSRPTVLKWMRNPVVGERLQAAFFAADSDESARQLADAHELWTS